jgi:hypothetical protein
MTEDLTALLERLKQLDSSTYDAYMHGMIARGGGFTAKMVMTKVQEAWLQFCVQRACGARSWYWQVGHGNHIGYVGAVKDGAKLVYGSSPCHALLAAYISALESKH